LTHYPDCNLSKEFAKEVKQIIICRVKTLTFLSLNILVTVNPEFIACIYYCKSFDRWWLFWFLLSWLLWLLLILKQNTNVTLENGFTVTKIKTMLQITYMCNQCMESVNQYMVDWCMQTDKTIEWCYLWTDKMVKSYHIIPMLRRSW
jgi:hypothetical protein